MQLNHYNSTFKKQKFSITLVCDNVTNAPNIGSLLRISDALGVKELVFCGDNVQLGKRIKKTSRATEKYVSHKIQPDILEVVKDLKAKDNFIIALEITDSSISLNDFKLNTEQPITLIIGNESFGISEDILILTDATIHINMYGENTSMNVVQATSIALYEMTKQLKS
ncbi:RNA methyltransferase [Winogradskyella sp. PC-19]|uniref:TrmH family RNA methyltransferase n=1 Tax=unclassified Winogradskyella TaxID=2615021 RepID=UPI000B3C3575|nr:MULTISPECIES: TrmH family RNA methyltransferase [unclassified Winogradskyella]ARV08666.1 RNA methyltransferase [Winogradskyella sp. PC-19]RZN76447.1 MAG: TrmH family RNA methyltransferase [Winogradskyella sp.]